MATVYLCTDLRDRSQVALKVIRSELASAIVIERFLREITYASELDHPRIPRVLDSGTVDGLPFYVMTFVEGESVRLRLSREKQLAVDEAVAIACDVAGTASYAHQRGIVHRDIKPENLLIGTAGVYVLDFGIARAVVESGVDLLTSTGVAVGTPAYMSPEQALGERDLDGRSDVYSIGCVLYEMIGGIPPFVGPTAQVTIARRFAAAAPPLRELRDGVPAAIAAAVARALARAPADRWQTAADFERALRSPPAHTMDGSSLSAVAWKLLSRRRAWVRVAALLTLSILSVAAYMAIRISASRAVATALDPRHVAVLYFDDHSVDESLEYLANGLTESLIRELGGVAQIKVVSRNGVKPYRDTSVGLDSISAALQVGSVVEGSVQQSGNRIRVTAQLIDARTKNPIGSTSVERDAGELFQLEDALAQEVAGMLRRGIGLQIRIRDTDLGTRNPRARELVFRADKARDDAEAAAASRDTRELARGIALLGEADLLLSEAELEDRRWIGPVIARGWVSLDVARRQGGDQQIRAFARALRHANRAVARAPGNASALELRGNVLSFEALRLPLADAEFRRLLASSERDLKRAVELDPNLAAAWGTLSRVDIALGNVAGAQRNAEKAFAMDAYLRDAPAILLSLYAATLMSGNVTASWKWCERGAREYPTSPRFLECQLTLLAGDWSRPPDPRRAWLLVKEGARLDPPSLAKASGLPLLPLYREMQAAIVSARAGHRDSALSVAARVRKAAATDAELSTDLAYEEAFLHLTLGDRPKALALVSRYLAVRPSLDSLVSVDPRWRSLRRDTAFARITRTVRRASKPQAFR